MSCSQDMNRKKMRISMISVNKAQNLGRNNKILFACAKRRLIMLIEIQSTDLFIKICFVHQNENWSSIVSNGLIYCSENFSNS